MREEARRLSDSLIVVSEIDFGALSGRFPSPLSSLEKNSVTYKVSERFIFPDGCLRNVKWTK